MHFILDFDNVVFDTEALKRVLAECGIGEDARGSDVFTEVLAQKPDFDFASLVFPDALAFMREHRGHCTIVSSAISNTDANNTNTEAQMEFQWKKIEAAGITKLLGVDHIKVTGESKADALKEVHQQYGDVLFVDDREKYVREANELGIRSVLMVRESTFGFERIRSTHEFAHTVSDFEALQKLTVS